MPSSPSNPPSEEKLERLENLLESVGKQHRANHDRSDLPEMPDTLIERIEKEFGNKSAPENITPIPLNTAITAQNTPKNVVPITRKILRPKFALLAAAAAVVFFAGISVIKQPKSDDQEIFRGHKRIVKSSEIILFNVDTAFANELKEGGLDINSSVQISGEEEALRKHMLSSEADSSVLIHASEKEIQTYRKGQARPVTINPLPDSAEATISVLQDLMK